ncbi:hypothetical protein CGC56_00040 [Capnocytophaga canimorsus]|uniref:BIG2 domain-containing protein n=1 Tax=Capnocytophaga canimorsus TaxID=28188 RepID=A0A250G0D4_9FLAO|nr:Ig-like domain-containing protein [Capnocytophaga canimorsus]ATA90701.1 hypothetical protein CGC56_00040 [Capnocytophaga canimorsus]
MKKIISFLGIATMLFTFMASCSKNAESTSVLPITLSVNTDLTLEIGQTSEVITIQGGDGNHFRIINTNASVAQIKQENNTFTVEAIRTGETTIVVNSAGKSKSLKVIVAAPAVSFGEITSPLALKVGESKVIPLSGGDQKEFSATSSDAQTLEVSISEKNLTIKALKAGNATITVSSAGKTAQLEVSITNVLIESIKIDEPQNFKPGNYRLSATILPENATQKTLIWESDAPNVVQIINQNTGEIFIKPRYGQSATISVKSTDGSQIIAQHTISVVKLVEKITFTWGKTQKLDIGNKNIKLDRIIEPADATNQVLEWESSHPDVVSVDNQGRISTHKEGSAIITAKATDGSHTHETIEIKVILAINKVTIDQAQGETMQIKKGQHPLSISIWHNDELKEAGITDKSKSGLGYVRWKIADKPKDNTANFGWKNGEKHILYAPKTGVITIEATYHDTLENDYISKKIIVTITE